MYRKTSGQLEFELFSLPFGGKLSPTNRWIELSNLIPWESVESDYSEHFSKRMEAPAKPVRMALGALIIKERMGLTDEETVEQIKENPYLQCFIGLKEFSDEAPFDASMMVHFRKRFSLEMLQKLNERIVSEQHKSKSDDCDNDGEGGCASKEP